MTRVATAFSAGAQLGPLKKEEQDRGGANSQEGEVKKGPTRPCAGRGSVWNLGMADSLSQLPIPAEFLEHRQFLLQGRCSWELFAE